MSFIQYLVPNKILIIGLCILLLSFLAILLPVIFHTESVPKNNNPQMLILEPSLPGSPIVAFSDYFEGSVPSGWIGNHQDLITTSTDISLSGSKSLKLNYTTGTDLLSIKRNISPTSDVLARIFFYDNMSSSLNVVFQVDDADESNTTLTFLGVNTAIDATHYVMRNNKGPSTNVDLYTKSTGVNRSLGWHLFELITINDGAHSGTFAKIDNVLLRCPTCWNQSQTSVASVALYATRGVTSTTYWDDLAVITSPNASGDMNRLWLPLIDHWNLYKNTDFSPLYAQFGNGNDNNLRSLLDTASVFYLVGKHFNDSGAVNKGKSLFRDILNNVNWDPYNGLNKWTKGISGLTLSYSAYLMQSELSADELFRIKNIIRAIAESYFNNCGPTYFYPNCPVNKGSYNQCLPESCYIGDTTAEENAWNSAFLTAAANLFPPDATTYAKWEQRAKSFAYHSITISSDSPYDGIKTQTVYDNTFKLENHGIVNPQYALAGALRYLGIGALSYKLNGKTVPSEFYHHFQDLYNNFVRPNINVYHYHYISGIPIDWQGAYNSIFIGNTALTYINYLGLDPNISWDDFFIKRNLFYYQIPAAYDFPPSRINSFSQDLTPCTTWSLNTCNSLFWFLNSAVVGEDVIPALMFKDLFNVVLVAPTFTPTPTPSLTPTPIATSTPIPPTVTPTQTLTPTPPTNASTPTLTPPITLLPTNTPSATPANTPTPTGPYGVCDGMAITNGPIGINTPITYRAYAKPVPSDSAFVKYMIFHVKRYHVEHTKRYGVEIANSGEVNASVDPNNPDRYYADWNYNLLSFQNGANDYEIWVESEAEYKTSSLNQNMLNRAVLGQSSQKKFALLDLLKNFIYSFMPGNFQLPFIGVGEPESVVPLRPDNSNSLQLGTFYPGANADVGCDSIKFSVYIPQ